jgi:hypothetical protein
LFIEAVILIGAKNRKRNFAAASFALSGSTASGL